jgi:HEPN domain-containing protein
MKKNDLIDYWLESSNKDYKTMKNLYRSKDYHWSLFMGHLVLEKLFKAHFIKLIDINPPKTHDLLRLVEKSNLNVNEKQKENSGYYYNL